MKSAWVLAACLWAGIAAAAQPAARPVAKAASRPASQAVQAASAASRAATPAAAVAAAPAPVASPHERELDAIRQAIVEATTGSPMRVLSSAWIDERGSLHETTQFTSDARIRGVRVLSYLEEPLQREARERVQVLVDKLPPGVGAAPGAEAAACLDRQRRWRQTLHVEMADLPPALMALAPMAAHRLGHRLARDFMTAAAESRRWTVRARPYQPVTSYERALVGRTADRTDWLARLWLDVDAAGSVPGKPPMLAVRLELHPVDGSVPAITVRQSLPWGDLTGDLWAPVLAEAVAAMDRETACAPVWYSVGAQGNQLFVFEGASHGLQVGDRLLLVDRAHLPGRLLEAGATSSMALLQVASTQSGLTQLRWLAGPRPAAGVPAGQWVALPL